MKLIGPSLVTFPASQHAPRSSCLCFSKAEIAGHHQGAWLLQGSWDSECWSSHLCYKFLATESAPLLPFKFLLGEKKIQDPHCWDQECQVFSGEWKDWHKVFTCLGCCLSSDAPQRLLHISWHCCCFHSLFVLVLTLPPYRRGYLFLVPQSPRYQKLCNRFPTMSYLNTLDQLLTNQNK